MAEDLLHDLFVEVLDRYDISRPAFALLKKLAAMRCRDLLATYHHHEALPPTLSSWTDIEAWLDAREAAGKVRKALTRAEVELLLREFKKRSPANVALKIRLTRRKARAALNPIGETPTP